MSTGQRVALVTGAARGIGQAIALRLAETGHALVLADILPADETVTAIKDAGGQAVNVEASFQLCAAFVPGMAERGFGRIINVASNTVWKPPGPGFVAYIASKGAVVGFTRAMATELGSSGITVNAIAPGLTRSPGAEEGNTAEHFEQVRLAQAIKRSLQPGDMAGTVAFLASDDASMITGQAIRIDGGLATL